MSDNPAPLVTIAAPVFNRLSYLGATLDGVLAQSCREWELIVVDDGSEEDVAGFVAGYSDPRISYVRQSNQGNAAARNAGISLGRGEYVICLDSDDVWQPEMLRSCVDHLAAHAEVDVAYTQVQAIDGHGRPVPRPVGPQPRNGDLLEPLLLGFPILPSSALARRACFEQWGVYTPGLDDWELWLRWAAKGCRFACIERALLNYRLHEQNLNLAFDRRRAAHFAMLDCFYERGDLPAAALRLRERAYAEQHFKFAVLAGQVGRPADSEHEFVQAVMRYPAFLGDNDFYTQIACAHQGRLQAGTATDLDLDVAEAALRRCLAALYGQPELPREIQAGREEAYGRAYLALARLAYGMAHDMGRARRWFLQAAWNRPGLAVRSDWAVWMMRSLVGYSAIQSVKRQSRPGVHRA